MKRRQLLQTGLAVGGMSAFVSAATSKPWEGPSVEPAVPIVSTRGHLERRTTYEGRRYTGRKVLPTEGHTKTDYDTKGAVPGVDRGCVPDLAVVVHGWAMDETGEQAERGARDKFRSYRSAMESAGYKGTVAGFSWQSDMGGSGALSFPSAKECAKANGPKLARFLREYRQACPDGVLRLVSHSLGCHVTEHALRALTDDPVWNRQGYKIDTVSLLAAAMDNEVPTPERETSHLGFKNEVGHTFNYFSGDDDAMQVYKWTQADQPLGMTGIEDGNTPPPNYTDINVTAEVGDDHSGYMKNLSDQIVKHIYEGASAPQRKKPDNGNDDDTGDGSEDDGEGNPPSDRFDKGDQVESTTDLNTRSEPGTGSGVLKTMSPGSVGSITGGPNKKSGYIWWRVKWNDGTHGWSAEKYLKPSDGNTDGGDTGTASGEADTWDAAHASNYTNGSRGSGEINWIVIHVTQGSYGGAVSWFKNPDADVSSHYVIRNSDGHTTQMVKHEDIAWHAGGRNHNQYSIGIEHEGHVGQTTFTDALYKRSAAIVSSLCEQYDIPKHHPSGTAPLDASNGGGIIGHHQIPENSHTDPGSTWDWNRFMALVNGNGGGSSGDDGGNSDDGGNNGDGGNSNGGGGSGQFSDGDTVAATTNLNTRKQPGTNSRVLKTMKPGATGKVMNGPVEKDGYTWWGVRWTVGNDYIWGWSAGKYLKLSDGSGGSGGSDSSGGGGGKFSDGDRVKSTTDLNTRKQPGTGSRVLKTMKPGATGMIMNGPVEKDGYTWWGVRWDVGNEYIWGWSAGKYLEKQ